jgi:hypothetical protein
MMKSMNAEKDVWWKDELWKGWIMKRTNNENDDWCKGWIMKRMNNEKYE